MVPLFPYAILLLICIPLLEIKDAELVFSEMPDRDLISFNTLMSSYIQSGHDADALDLFAQLLRVNKEANYVTFANALGACSNPEALLYGKAVHALVTHYLASLVTCCLVML